MFVVNGCRSQCRFLAMIFAGDLIGMALSMTGSDTSTFFPDDDTNFFTAGDFSAINTEQNAGGFFSDMVSSLPASSSSSFSTLNVFSQADDLEPSILGYTTDPDLENSNDDSQWLNANSGSDLVSDAAPFGEVSSSCIGEDENSSSSSSTSSPYFRKKDKKMRREDIRSMCLENKDVPASSSGLNFPHLTNLEQSGSGSKTAPNVDVAPLSQNEYRCPPQQSEHVCCSGPVIEEYPFLGLYEQVQNCEPCMLSISYHCLSDLSYIKSTVDSSIVSVQLITLICLKGL